MCLPFPIQLERTFIAIKPDGVQRGLVSENYYISYSPSQFICETVC